MQSRRAVVEQAGAQIGHYIEAESADGIDFEKAGLMLLQDYRTEGIDSL